MPFDQIMESIQAGLTGDSRKDIRYLQDQIAFHRNHENGLEIARACGRLIYECLPDELKKRFRESMDRDTESWNQVIAEADLNIRNQNYEKALKILEPVVNDLVQFEQFHFQNDSQTEYHDFHELFEELLYRELSHSELDFKPVPIPFTALYSRYGNLLFELGRYGDASDILEKGLRWNPVDINLMLEYAECHKASGNMERFYQITMGVFDIAFTPAALGRCYRNLGYYYAEKENWDVAASIIYMSMQYDPDSEIARGELAYIEDASGKPLPEQSFQAFQQYSTQYNLPVGASELVLSVAYSCGHYFLRNGRKDIARYLFSIFYNLTYNEDIKAILEGIDIKL